jgi:hypothetical protein
MAHKQKKQETMMLKMSRKEGVISGPASATGTGAGAGHCDEKLTIEVD